jgi:hypothetical protein
MLLVWYSSLNPIFDQLRLRRYECVDIDSMLQLLQQPARKLQDMLIF